jgi:3-hydroxyacyl-CoA dehydrogenase/enoyl-CoA hydratase/3-hydroxybutyryl-CoA epimerase
MSDRDDHQPAVTMAEAPREAEGSDAGVSYQLRPDGLAFLIFDRAREKVNVLSSSLVAVLELLLDKAARDRNVRGLIVASAKEGSFIAGADIREIESLRSAQDAENASRRGHRLFAGLERMPFPVVAAISGTCLGGGTELALACHFRVAADWRRTEIGLPEVRLGILPGWGGTQRLPRLVGVAPALDLILTGRSLNARQALKIGLVDAVTSPERLLEAAERLVSDAVARRRRPRRRLSDNPLARLDPLRAARTAVVVGMARRRLRKRLNESHYPAPFFALDAVSTGLQHGMEEGLRREAELIGRLATGGTSRNLVAIFSMQEEARRASGASDPAVRPRDVRAAGVIGAGVMGGGIAQALSRVGLPVRLKDIDISSLARGIKTAYDLGQNDLRNKRIPRREFDRRMDRILPALDYSGLLRSEIIIEAVVESTEVKRRVLADLESFMPEGFVFATNTSSLPIEQIAAGCRRPDTVVGMHFFNPVHRMPLVEVIRGPATSDETVATVVGLSRRIGKTPVVVADAPGFLVNRILMAYLGEALLLLEEGARIEEVDRTMVEFGMPVGPFALLDQVGLDVAAHVAGILTEAFRDRAPRATALQIMCEKEWFGCKSGRGFYLYGDGRGRREGDGGDPGRPNGDVYGLLAARDRRSLDAGAIESRLVLPMVNEAARCLEAEIVRTPAEIDLAMVMGTGFPPFRGGLLHHADGLGLMTVVQGLEVLASHHGQRFQPAELLVEAARANRRFF